MMGSEVDRIEESLFAALVDLGRRHGVTVQFGAVPRERGGEYDAVQSRVILSREFESAGAQDCLLAHELGHALLDQIEGTSVLLSEQFLAEEKAWAAGRVLVEALGYPLPPEWADEEYRSLASYYVPPAGYPVPPDADPHDFTYSTSLDDGRKRLEVYSKRSIAAERRKAQDWAVRWLSGPAG